MELPCIKHVVVVGEEEDYLAVLLTLQTEPDEFDPEKPGTTLTEESRRWFRHARFDMRNIEDVIENMEGGLQVGDCVSIWFLFQMPNFCFIISSQSKLG